MCCIKEEEKFGTMQTHGITRLLAATNLPGSHASTTTAGSMPSLPSRSGLKKHMLISLKPETPRHSEHRRVECVAPGFRHPFPREQPPVYQLVSVGRRQMLPVVATKGPEPDLPKKMHCMNK
jgi:hypothetical protein